MKILLLVSLQMPGWKAGGERAPRENVGLGTDAGA